MGKKRRKKVLGVGSAGGSRNGLPKRGTGRSSLARRLSWSAAALVAVAAALWGSIGRWGAHRQGWTDLDQHSVEDIAVLSAPPAKWWARRTARNSGAVDMARVRAAGIETLSTLNWTVALTPQPTALVGFYDPESVSWHECVDEFIAAARALKKARESALRNVRLHVVDVAVHGFLQTQVAAEFDSAWQEKDDEAARFKFGKPNYFPFIVKLFRRGVDVDEYVGPVNKVSILQYLRRQIAPILIQAQNSEALDGYILRDAGVGGDSSGVGGDSNGVGGDSSASKSQPVSPPSRHTVVCTDADTPPASVRLAARELHGLGYFYSASLQACRGSLIGAWLPAARDASIPGDIVTRDCVIAVPKGAVLGGATGAALSSDVKVIANASKYSPDSTPAVGNDMYASRVLPSLAEQSAEKLNNNSLTAELARHWARVEVTVDQITPDNSHVYLSDTGPIRPLFVALVPLQSRGEAAKAAVLSRIKDLIFRLQDLKMSAQKPQWVWSDGNVYAGEFGLDEKQLPALLAVDPTDIEDAAILRGFTTRDVETDVGPNSRDFKFCSDFLAEFSRRHPADIDPPVKNMDNKFVEDILINTEASADPAADKGGSDSSAQAAVSGTTYRSLNFSALPFQALWDFYHVNLDRVLTFRADLRRKYPKLSALYPWRRVQSALRLTRLPPLSKGPIALAKALQNQTTARLLRRNVERRSRKFHQPSEKLKKSIIRACSLLETELYAFRAWLVEQSRSGRLGRARGRLIAIDKVAGSNLTLVDFIERYAKPRKPVIISGLNLTRNDNWNLDFFRKRCGDRYANLQRRDRSKHTWGSLVDAEALNISEFIGSFRTNATRRGYYLHDWGLPRYCPGVFGPPPYDGFKIPKYFAGDYFQRSPFVGYRHSWPSLFIGSAETQSAMHIDSGGTHFWMLLLSGRKEWRFFSRRDRALLYEDADAAYDVDVFDANHVQISPGDRSFSATSHPLLEHADMYRGVQEAGDLVFIPAGAPHAVKNLDDIHALSMNYVDPTNYYLYLHLALVGEQFRQFELYTDPEFPHGLRPDQQAVTMGEFKSADWTTVKNRSLM